jgi:hypothetical protein
MKSTYTPGPWHAEAEDGPGLDEIDGANANLIAAAPTMHKKLTDTVAWLDREIETWKTIDTPLPTRATASLIERLTELRDDLAETLRIS